MASSLNGTGLTFSSGATLNSPPVTSIATGNGLQGGTITTTGTLSLAAPAFNTVGSYCFAGSSGNALVAGSNYAAGTGGTQIQAATVDNAPNVNFSNILSGTWKWMGASMVSTGAAAIAVRVA